MKIKFGVLAAAATIGLMSAVSQAKADIITYRAPFAEPTAVYKKCFMGARIALNTRGRLARGPRTSYVETPGTWESTRHAPIFFATQRVVSPQHVYLVPAGSPCWN